MIDKIIKELETLIKNIDDADKDTDSDKYDNGYSQGYSDAFYDVIEILEKHQEDMEKHNYKLYCDLQDEQIAPITNFGIFCRYLRIKNKESIYDMARKLNVTFYFLLAVEWGEAPQPGSWREKFIEIYKLNSYEILTLGECIYRDLKNKINNRSDNDIEK